MNDRKGFLYELGLAMRSIIGISIVFLSFGFLFVLMFVKIPHENESIINVASGLVLGVLGTVAAYYFGSSKDKSDQDKVANANQLQNPIP